MIKSRIGLLAAVAGFLIAVSPEARKALRAYAVKGTELFIDVNDKLKLGTRR